MMSSLSTPEEIKLLEENNTTFKAKLNAMRNKYKQKLIVKRKSSANKKITPQRFFTTKKANKKALKSKVLTNTALKLVKQ